MLTVAEKPVPLGNRHVANFGQIVKLRRDSGDLIDYAHHFYRGQWGELMDCVHCVSEKYLDSESNRARIRELVAEQEQIIAGLKALVA